MMFFRNIKSNFYKIITGYGFYACIIFTTFLCFSSNIYEDFSSGEKYSAIMLLFNFDINFMLKDTSFCSFEVMHKGAGSWLSLFIPIVAAFAFIPLVCNEYEAKSVRFQMVRSTKICFYSSKFITACLCGGLAVMLGFGLFVLIEYAIFPNISEYETNIRCFYEESLLYQYPDIREKGYFYLVIKNLGNMFLYGAVCAAPIIVLTSIVRNKYLVLCIPFFIKYGINQTFIKFQLNMHAKHESFDTNFLRAISIINPDALSYMSQYGEDKKYVLIYSGIIISVCAILYLILCLRSIDCGE